jgi:hypothetical protein
MNMKIGGKVILHCTVVHSGMHNPIKMNTYLIGIPGTELAIVDNDPQYLPLNIAPSCRPSMKLKVVRGDNDNPYIVL